MPRRVCCLPRLNQAPRTWRQRLLPALAMPGDQKILGLLEGLPHLTAGASRFRAPLRLLLPPALRPQMDRLLPWGVERDSVVLACSRVPPEESISAIQAWSGLRVRCVLCAPEAVREAARMGAVKREDVPSSGTHGPAKAAWDDGLDAVQRRQILALARQLSIPEETAAAQVLGDAHARRRPAAMLQPSAEALATLPARLAHSLAALPLRLTLEHLEVALSVDSDDEEEVAEALAIVTGRTVRVRRVASSALRAALGRSYQVAGAQAVSAPPAGVAVAGELSALVAAFSENCPAVESGLALQDSATALEALSLLHELPAIRLEHYAVLPDVAGPPALKHCGNWVPHRCVARGRCSGWPWPIRGRDHATLARLSGLHIRPVLASP